MATKGYQGHKNWNHWNVSLWISNDEGLYRLALEAIRECPTKADAADRFCHTMRSYGQYKTPDGAPWTKTAVLAALRGLEA